ncbi:MAG: YqjF family protein [Candidatus Polarisedimenticolia bacterium]
MTRGPFLTARWESIVLLNYSCPAALLEPFVPPGTALDTWDGDPVVSLVGFLFRRTRVRGVPIPLHGSFEEVNLRFYVRRRTKEDPRRGVVFIRELVPRLAVASVARWAYNEPYLTVPMSHRVSLGASRGGSASYAWTHRGDAFSVSAEARGAPRVPDAGSEAEFFTEHHWGYTRQRDGGTLEYQVDHPRWPVWDAMAPSFSGPAARLYGAGLGEALSRPPRSAFVALGSDVAVHTGRRLRGEEAA